MATDAAPPDGIEPPFDINLEEYCLKGRDEIPDDHFDYTSPDWEAYDKHDSCIDALFTNPNRYDAVAIVDCGDADGLTCGTLYKHRFDNCLIWPAAHNGFGKDPLEVFDALERTTGKREVSTPVYIADLGPDEEHIDDWRDSLTAIRDNIDAPLHFRDHHQGGEPLEDVVDSFTHDEDRSAAQIVRDTDHPDAPPTLQELTDAVGIRDLWQADHPRFEAYQLIDDAGFYLSFNQFSDLAIDHGLDLADADPEINRELREQYYIGTRAAEWVIERADRHTIDTDVATYDVMIGFGACKINIAGHWMIDEHDADIAVIIQPSGTVNFRSAPDVPYSERIAAHYGGGGHECAGAADFEWSDEQIDTYRETRAAPVKERLLDDMAEVLNDCPRRPDDDTDT